MDEAINNRQIEAHTNLWNQHLKDLPNIWDSVCLIPPPVDDVVVHVFHGGRLCEQLIPFERATAELKRKIKPISFIYLGCAEIHSGFSWWQPSDLVNWLLSSHVHFILTHPHQGLEGLRWNIDLLYREMQRLEFHPGFPSGTQLKCPIFTQNKF
jgi:hypothetical protein